MKKALLFAVLGMVAASQAGAQGLYKCTTDGKVTYQSMPCAKGGEALDVPPPPTAAQIKAAQARMQEDLERVKQLSASNRADRERKAREEEEEAAANKRVTKADCDKMRSRREELYGQRLVDRRGSQLDALAKTQAAIDSLEAEYTKASCGPLD
jgi:Skp family chaperone for outer membrane proteins